MKISVPDFAFPLLKYDQFTRLASMLDFSYVDVGLMRERTHHQPDEELTNPSRNALVLRGELALRGLKCSDLFYQAGNDFEAVAVNHPDAEIREKLRTEFDRVLEYAVTLGGGHLTILPGADFGEGSFDRAAEELAFRVEKAEKAGLKLGVEAHLGSLVPTPEKALALCQAVSGLTLTLDLSHFVRQGIEFERCVPLFPYASHLHLRGANAGELQCPVKDSTIPVRELIEGVRNAGFDGAVDLEYTYSPWENSDRTDNLSEILQMRTRLTETGYFD